jgi:hypothetical protein
MNGFDAVSDLSNKMMAGYPKILSLFEKSLGGKAKKVSSNSHFQRKVFRGGT